MVRVGGKDQSGRVRPCQEADGVLLRLGVVLAAMLMGFADWAIAAGETGKLYDPSRPPEELSIDTSQEAKATTEAPVDEAQSRWVLKMVRLGGREPKALINGRFVRTGESVDGLEVTAINRHEVEGLVKSKPVQLQMNVLRPGQGVTVHRHAVPGPITRNPTNSHE
ncbi:MAG: hypothetical protein HQL74_10320 [Magnetococcales bacterium]|nr:hypothetical protein [Magnetococcales bacterium]